MSVQDRSRFDDRTTFGSTGPSAFRGRLNDLLQRAVERGGSDLHLKPRRPPLLRVNGKLVPLEGRKFSPADLHAHLIGLLTDEQQQRLADSLRIEFGYSVPGVARFRGTIYHQRGTLVASFRRLQHELASLEELNLPDRLGSICSLGQGLVVIAGERESGRSTTLAALLREIADHRLVQVMTIEDPIEYLIEDGMGSVTQQEIGTDTTSYLDGLEHALRQDPDMVVLDRVDDAELFQAASAAAQADCLVLTTLRATSCRQAIDKLLSLYVGRNVRQARRELAHVLKAVVVQQLVERADGRGKVAAVEILRDSAPVRTVIAEGSLDALDRHLTADPMQSMDQSLAALLVHGQIDYDEALRCARDPEQLEQILRVLCDRTGESDTGDDDMSTADYSTIRRALHADPDQNWVEERAQAHSEQQDERVARLEAELNRAREERDGARATLKALEAEREQILASVERHSQEVDRESQRLQERIGQLEAQLHSQGVDDDERGRRLQLLEEERQRVVELIETHFRDYELKIAKLEARLRERDAD